MPIMAAHTRSDARGTARLLATMALASIGNPTAKMDSRIAAAESQEVALNNMYRLLQAFRKDAFFGQEMPRQSRQSAAEKLTLRPRVERNVRQVREALAQAAAIAFAGQSNDEAIEAVERVLRWIAYPRTNSPPSDTDRTRTISFFRELVDRL